MMQHPQVVTAAAIVKDKTHLIGYFTPATVSSEELQDMVSSLLPVYMVPAVWVGLDVMPQNTNGKTDKKALEALDVVVDMEALASESERRMASVWADVLHVDVCEIGRRTSFFALGGDSMTAIKVVAACKAAGLSITTAQLLKAPVLWKAASCSASTASLDTWPSIVLSQEILASVQDEWTTQLNLVDYTVYPVTPLQAGMVYATVKNPTAYIMQVPLIVDATFDTEALSTAFSALVEKHEILRTTFVTSTSGIYQVIRHDAVDLPMTNIEASNIDSYLDDDRARGFEVGDKYFVRLTLVKCQDVQYGVFTIHHALYDGWTLSIIVGDLIEALQGNALTARPSFRRVVDYVEAQDVAATEAFWRSYLGGYVSSPLGSSGQGYDELLDDSEALVINTQVSVADIKAAAQRVGVSPAEFNKIAWAVTLRKYTRQDDVVFGQVMANRDIPVKDADSILGPLINTVPYRVKFDEAGSLQAIFDAVQHERGGLLAHS
ncbi:hypothetical protein As57867_007780, partial [Aphanomyces stellatus]